MRVCMLSVGTEGDVRPFVALGQRINEAGHRALIVTGAAHTALVERGGVQLVAINADSGRILQRNRKLLDGRNSPLFWRKVRRAYRLSTKSWMVRTLEATEGADLIVSAWINAPLAQAVAEKHGVPFVAVAFMPVTPSRSIPALWPSPVRPRPSALNLVAHHAARLLFRRAHSPRARAMRRSLGLPGRAPPHPIIYAFSPHVLPPPPDWANVDCAVVGFWTAPGDPDWKPPGALLDFLAAGPIPIYVGFGSMVGTHPRAFTQMIIEAVREAGRRAILATGWGAMSGSELGPSDDIFVLDRAPHDWLFGHVDLAVHHGGAGTLASAARAALPQVIVPFVLDQPFWAWQANKIGISPMVLDQRTITADSLADAIRRAGADPIRTAARVLASRLKDEDGIGNTLAVLRGWGLLPAVPQTVR